MDERLDQASEFNERRQDGANLPSCIVPRGYERVSNSKTCQNLYSADMLRSQELFPAGFCGETLRTIALLLPSADRDVMHWYRKQQFLERLDSRAAKLPILRIEGRQINGFHFWRQRLTILKQAFDEAEPSTISQWWYDRRRGPQWYTFWVAIIVLALTVFFGLAQLIEGAIQVYFAWHQ
jgi:hypothetical protein